MPAFTFPRLRLALFAAWAAVTLLGIPPGARAAEPALSEVGRHDLDGRGVNSGLAIGDHCAYIGSRSDQPPLVLDITEPAYPHVVGQLAAHPGSTSRELRVAPAMHLLVVMSFALRGGALNQLDLYRWADDCAHPSATGHYGFGARRPHEFFLWQDPQRAGRVLLFVTTPDAGGGRNLEVVDVSDPAEPKSAGGWDLPSGLGAGAHLHSIAVSADGRRAYLSLWTGGLLVADASEFASSAAQPALRLLTPPGQAFRYPGNVHSAVPFPDRPLVLVTDEEYGGCPFGWARIVDVTDVTRPRQVSQLQAAENDPPRCSAAARGTWTSHNPTLTPHLALISWYSAGLEVFDVTDPVHPHNLARYRPAGTVPRRREPLGLTDTLTWSYPVIRDGLIYVVDINQGLAVLRYEGISEDEVARLAFLEGNSNVTAAKSPGEPGPATLLPAPPVRPPASQAPHGLLPAAAAGLGLAFGALVAVGAVLLVWRRRRR